MNERRTICERTQQNPESHKIKYIDVRRGEMRIALHPDGTASISGGATDPDMQRYQAIDGLRVRIGELNGQIADCIAATDALGRKVMER